MAHRSEKIRRRVLLAFGAVSLLGMTTAILCIYWMQAYHIDEELAHRLVGSERLLDSLVRQEAKVLQARLVLLAADEQLRELWLRGDREGLLNASRPLFANMQTHLGIDHFYFIKPDGTCFLRVHQPEMHGDLIGRYTLEQARRRVAPVHGLELGPLGTFTLRLVLPWRIDGEIAGYLELGEGIENITPKLREVIGIELLFVLDKKRLEQAAWEEGREMLGLAADWDHFPDVVVDNRTFATIPAELEEMIRLPREGHLNRSFAIAGKKDTRFYGGFLPLVDAQGRELGEIVIVQDVTEEIFSLHVLTGVLASVLVALGSGLFVFFYFFIGRVERKLLVARDDLVTEIEERRQAQRELTGYQERLEEKVAARTRDLQVANTSLHEEVASRKEAERQARKATDEWERTFEAIGDIVTIHDEDMRMVRVNRAAADALGCERRDLLGRRCYEVFRGEDSPCEGCPEARALQEGKQHTAEIEHPNLGRIFQVTASPLADEEGRFSGVVHTARDITAQKQLESQLRQVQRIEAVGTLAGGVAHDFNNILTGVLGYSELCLGEIAPGSQVHADLAEIMRLAGRGADLIRQLQAFSRRQTREPVVLDLNGLIADLLKMLRRLIGENIDIQFRPGPELGRVESDPGQLEQILINLAVNARDAMPEGGMLAIETAQVELGPAEAGRHAGLAAGSYARLVVCDSGPGMDRETLQRIFDPFFTTKNAASSSGLGLAVIFGIVRQHRGSIQAESSPGRGTSFIIHLPLAAGEQQALTAPLPSLAGRVTILLVEDEPTVRDVVARMLEKIGCRVLVAESPEMAEEIFKAHAEEVFLLLTDVIMPKCNGKELYQKILHLKPEIRVLFMSGYVDRPVVQSGIMHAGLPFIAKPFSPERLAVKIREIIKEEKGDGRARLPGSD